MPVLKVNVPTVLLRIVENEVEAGEYDDASQVVQDALRRFADGNRQSIAAKKEELRRKIAVGIQQIENGEYGDLNMEEILAEADARVKARKNA